MQGGDAETRCCGIGNPTVGAGNAGWGIQVGDVEGIGDVQWIHGKNEGMHDGGWDMGT